MLQRLISHFLLIKLFLKVLSLISLTMKHKLWNFIKQEVSILKKSKLFFLVIVLIVFLILLTIHLLNELYTPSDGVNIAIFGAIASTFGNIVNYQQQQDFQRKQIEMQKETNHLNWMMNERNNVYNAMLAEKMFNLENAYNTPKNQMKRLREAGINPFVAAGNVGNVEGRADTVPAQQPIPMVSPMAGLQAPQYNLGATLGADFANIASAIGSLARAKKDVGDDRRADATIDTIIEQMKSDIELKNEQRMQVSWQNAMNYKYGDKEAQKKLRNLDSDWAKAQQDMTESESRTWLTQIQADIADIERETKDAELKAVLPYLGKMAEQKYLNLKKEGRVLDAQAAQGFGAANASNTQAQLNVSKKKAQDVINKFLPQLSAWQVVAQQYDTYGKALVNKKTAQDMIIQAKKFLPEIRQIFAKGSEIYKNIEYLQGQIDKLPHEIDKIDSETWRNFCGGMKELMQSADIFTEMVVPF